MADKQNNPQAREAEEKTECRRQRLATPVKQWLVQHRINLLIFIFIIPFFTVLVFGSVPEWVSYLVR